MIRPIFYILTSLFCMILCMESLQASASIQEDDPIKTEARQLLDSSLSHRNISLIESIQLCQQAIKLAENTEDSKLLAKAYKTQGVNYFFHGDNDSSFSYYNKAIPQFEAYRDSVQVGKVLGNIGLLYKRQSQYDKALEYYLKNLKIFEEVNYQKGLGSVLNNIGNLYHIQENLAEAEKNYNLALINFKAFDYTKELANVYCNLGVVNEKRKNYDKSLEYYQKSLDQNKKLGNKLFESKLIFNIGYNYHMQGRHESAYIKVKEAETIRISLNDLEGIVNCKLTLARILSSMKSYGQAEKYFLDANQLAIDNNFLNWRHEILHHLTDFYNQQKNYKKAFQYQSELISVTHLISKAESDSRFEELITKYEIEKRKKELELLQQRTQIQYLEIGQKNAWIITLLVVLLLGVVAVLVSLRINRMRADHRIMDLRQKVLLTQMNPHFIFNSLTAIQSFILDNKNDEANNYLSSLASLVRGILENSREEFVSLRTELDTLKDYIDMQKLRFDNDIKYSLILDEKLDRDSVLVPPMLAQPFVENALIHGRLRNNPNAEIIIKVALDQTKNILQFEILDNGIGLEESQKLNQNKTHNSLATNIALDRVKIYNFKSSKKMKFEIVDRKHKNQNEVGTLVSYSIPLKLKKEYS